MIEIISIIGAWLICVVAAERAAEAITVSVFFSPLRQLLARLALMDLYWPVDSYQPGMFEVGGPIYKGWMYSLTKILSRWLSDLVSCGWCTSFWTSAFFSIFLPGRYLSLGAGDNALVKAIALWGFANLWHSIFRLVHNGRVAAFDVNFRLIEDNVDNLGENNAGSGQPTSQADTIRIEPPAV